MERVSTTALMDESDYMVKRFDEYNIKPILKSGLQKMNYSTATEVQDKSFSVMMGGKNVVVKSFTGSGKTLAFGIPLSERILRRDSNSVVIIGPTRELVVQVSTELQKLNKFSKLKIFTVYGGHGMMGEVSQLHRGFEILCATPGRLLDHIERGNLKHIKVDTVVLDEGDLMLDMGFQEDINKILRQLKPKNVHLFSATMEGKVTQVIKEHIPQYEMIDIQTEIVGTQILEEEIKISPERKFPKLLEYIDKSTGKILIFASTKRYVEILRERLEKENIRCCTIHSNITQRKREFALKDFQTGRINVLIATDVASRGIHIDDVEYVINYDSARSDQIHKHRIGRTGRMGKIGNAVTFVEEGKRKRRRDRTDDYLPKHLRENKEGSERKEGERRPFNRDRDIRSEKPTGGRRFKSDYSGGERRSYSSEGSERRDRPKREYSENREKSGEERRPYNRDGEKRPYRSEGERKPYNRDGEKRSYSSEGSERRSFHSEGERRPYRPEGSERRERPTGERRPYRSENNERSLHRGMGQTTSGKGDAPFRSAGERKSNQEYGADRKKERPHRQFQNRDESDGERRGPKKPEGRFQSTRSKVRSRFSKFKKR